MIRFLQRALHRVPRTAFVRPSRTRFIQGVALMPVGSFVASFAVPAEALRCEPFKAPSDKKWVRCRSGLAYVDIIEGSGDCPKRGQTVHVHYTGYLGWSGHGAEFDSSIPRGEPMIFKVGIGQVIHGWDEGVLSMKVGGRRKLVIPPHLGYGEQGAGTIIPPNETLVYDCELVAIRDTVSYDCEF